MDTTMDDTTTQAIFDFIGDYIQQRGYAPNVREIGKACFVSHSSVNQFLIKLEAIGLIRRDPHVARGISLTRKGIKLRKSRLTPR
jgi:SOS-response transcriptional repressor LexA